MLYKKLKIAMIAPLSERVPPKKYGGTERIVWTLTEELVKKGHDVTLFATGDSMTSAKLESVYPKSLREAKISDPYGLNEWALLNITNGYSNEKKFDIIHDHNSILSIPTASLSQIPTVVTIHGAVNQKNKRLYEHRPGAFLVAISESQTARFPQIPVFRTIYNGLNMKSYPYKSKHKGYLLYVGRISMEKGTHHAIDVAQNLNMPLIMAAKLDSVDKSYFQEYVESRLSDDNIEWIGEVDEKTRNKLMSEALCLLHPVTWREPFGLTMIEAMACGCPVVAFDKGSISEIIQDGKTGFVVSDTDEMTEAVIRIPEIKRTECRNYVLNKFSAQKMADNYETCYYDILKACKKLTVNIDYQNSL